MAKERRGGKVVYVKTSAEGAQAKQSIPGLTGFNLSAEKKAKLENDVRTHSKEDNDRAEYNITRALERETKVVTQYDLYRKVNYIKSAEDKWWTDHVYQYEYLTEELKEFKRLRKKYNQ